MKYTVRTHKEYWKYHTANFFPLPGQTVLLTGFHRLQEAYADHAILMYQEADMQPASPAFSGQILLEATLRIILFFIAGLLSNCTIVTLVY